MQDELDLLLSARGVPQTPHGLADRIIARAAMMPARREGGLKELIRNFYDLFALPRPALAMVITLLLGLTIGFNLNAGLPGVTTNDMLKSFTAADDTFDGAMP